MIGAEIKHNLIVVSKNPAGFIKDDTATVDNIFRSEELSQWLQKQGFESKWQDGVFEKLAVNRKYYETEDMTPLKNIRVWQLRQGFDVDCRFQSYAEMYARHGDPTSEDYKIVFDGELHTNDLEEIYDICNNRHPLKYTGHSLSMSDVVELYDADSSEFFYCDTFGFKQIDFEEEQPSQSVAQTSKLTMEFQ